MLQKWWIQVYKNATTAKLRHILIAKKIAGFALRYQSLYISILAFSVHV